MARTLLVFILAVGTTTAVRAQPAVTAEVGKPAPALRLRALLHAPAGTPKAEELDWAALKGKVVVLEFWGTRCGPCIMTMPHLNELASTFEHRPVRFISITDEDEQTVATFLDKHEMKGWIGLDADGSTTKAYGVRGIPHTVLIDPSGVVLGIMIPEQLTADVIRAVLAGERPTLPDGKGERSLHAGVDPGETIVAKPALFQVMLRQSDAGVATISQRPGKVSADGATLPQMIAIAWPGYSVARIILTDGCDTGHYTLAASMPPGHEAELESALRHMLASTFGIAAHPENRAIDTAVLTLPHGRGPGLKEAAAGRAVLTTGPGLFKVTNQDGRSVVSILGGELGMPVIDSTGLGDERYDIEASWDKDDPKGKLRSLLAATGIETATERRAMDVLVVDLKPPQRTDPAHD